jgi:hypothetical protein
MGKNQHVVKRDNGWAVRGENNSKDTSHHRTQKEANEAEKELRTTKKAKFSFMESMEKYERKTLTEMIDSRQKDNKQRNFRLKLTT